MGDVDAGNVKAKASIEYDGSGLKQMKEDLQSLPSMVGGLGDSAEKAGGALSGLDEQMGANAASTKSFNDVLAGLPKIAEGGSSTISGMTSALSEHQSAVEETGAAYESLQKPIESTVSTFEKAAPSIQAATEHTQKFAESVQTVSESFDPGMLSDFTENTAVFQDALMNPQPFSVIGQHLRETGQNWQDFTSSLSAGDEAMAYEMAGTAGITEDHLNMLGAQLQTVGTGFHESASSAEEFTKQFNSVSEAATRSSGDLGGFYEKVFGSASEAKSVSFTGAFGEAFGSITGFLNDLAMPLMAVQMIGMAVQQAGQAIYDSAAIAEGPAAHSFGTFTGTVDALGASLQHVGATFSEGFGEALLPTLNALNSQAANGDLRGLGQFLGGVASTLTNLTLITTGIDPLGGMQGLVNQGAQLMGLPQPYQGPGPTSKYEQYMLQLPQTLRDATLQSQEQVSLIMGEAGSPDFLAQQQRLQFAQTYYQHQQMDYNIRHPINPSQMIADSQYDTYAAAQEENYQYQMMHQPNPIGDWFSNLFRTGTVYSSGSSGGGQRLTTGGQPPSTPLDGSIFGDNGGTGGGGGSIGDFFGGIGKSISDFWNQKNGGADTLGMLFSPQAWGFGGDQSPQTFTGGCFVAGTQVLLADGSSKPIETLRVDEQVLAHDGEKQIPATIIGCIMLPAKQTYELTFSDGNSLITTDSHPLAGGSGWKSISPASTAQENPGLPVTALAVGDSIYTADGTLCRLISIQMREITTVYNITVSPHHTYYAGGILVHNAKASTGSMTNGGVGSEQVQLSHTFTANIQWEANNLQKQFTGVANWVGQGLSNTFNGVASWVAQGLSNTFQGVASWVGQGLANTFQGVANWVGQGLENTFQGVANWVGQGLSNTFQGVANWVGQGLSNTFKGIASWVGQGLEHTFTGTANWIGQNLNPTFTVNPSFTMLAEGTSDWPGGPAIVGEGGAPEVVEHNGQYSLIDHAMLLDLPAGANVYPMKNLQSSGVAQFADGTGNYMLPLTIGIPGGGMPQSINVNVHLDSQTILSAIEMPMAQNIRVASGLRSY